MSDPQRSQLLVLTSTYPRWHDDPEPGFVHELCKRLTDHFEVVVLAPHAAGAMAFEIMDGVHVCRYRYAPSRWETLVNAGGIVNNLKRQPWKWLLVPTFLSAQLYATWRLLRRVRPDVVHAHWLIPQGLQMTFLAAVLRDMPPFVVTSHGADLYALRGAFARKLKQRVVRSCAALTVVSNAMLGEAQRQALQAPQTEVLPMGVDMQQRFVPDEGRTRAADELLFVGRLVAKKGLRYLFDAMPYVVRQRPAVMLTVAGFGPEENDLRQQARRLGIERHVNFLGAVPQQALPELYRRAALFVAPFVRDAGGDQEGLPVALMEAIACGCPVVAGEVSGIEDLLGSAADAICVKPADVQELAGAIIRVLEDPLQARKQVRDIRQSVFERVDWSVVAEGYRRLLRSCADATSDTGPTP
jgi:glycosyltransferase involved in cell wall biosynthesis